MIWLVFLFFIFIYFIFFFFGKFANENFVVCFFNDIVSALHETFILGPNLRLHIRSSRPVTPIFSKDVELEAFPCVEDFH